VARADTLEKIEITDQMVDAATKALELECGSDLYGKAETPSFIARKVLEAGLLAATQPH
jgi:hypothetical protein